MKLSKKIMNCSQSPMRKFYPLAVKAQQAGKKIYHLNIGQPDIQTPDDFFETMKEIVKDKPVVAYSEAPGLPELLDKFAAYFHMIDAPYDPDDMLITVGGSEALSMLMLSILDEGSEVIVPEPFYPNYDTFVREAGGMIRPLTTTPEENYHYAERAKIEPLINENTRAILISNPGNPTGIALTRDELTLLGDIAKEHDLYLISDEVYREYVYDDSDIISLGQYPEFAENAVIIDSVSKRFSACGARIGVVLSKNKALIDQMLKICQGRLSAPMIDQLASAALYDADISYYEEVKEEYRHRRDICYHALLNVPGVVCAVPQGAFYIMAKLPIDDANKFQTWLLEEFDDNGETVMFAPGEGFYATEGLGVNEIRIAYVKNSEVLERAMEILVKGIEQYNARNEK